VSPQSREPISPRRRGKQHRGLADTGLPLDRENTGRSGTRRLQELIDVRKLDGTTDHSDRSPGIGGFPRREHRSDRVKLVA
jgi:hypothetical protein